MIDGRFDDLYAHVTIGRMKKRFILFLQAINPTLHQVFLARSQYSRQEAAQMLGFSLGYLQKKEDAICDAYKDFVIIRQRYTVERKPIKSKIELPRSDEKLYYWQ